MLTQTIRFMTILLAAFSLSLNMAHLLEFPQRMKFSQELWVEVTVFENVYKYFGTVGAFFEMGAILFAVILTMLVRKRSTTFYWTLSGAVFLILAFVSWILFVAPANAQFATWLNSPIPADWTRWRNQWENAHAINTFIKIFGVSFLIISILVEIPVQKYQNGSR